MRPAVRYARRSQVSPGGVLRELASPTPDAPAVPPPGSFGHLPGVVRGAATRRGGVVAVTGGQIITYDLVTLDWPWWTGYQQRIQGAGRFSAEIIAGAVASFTVTLELVTLDGALVAPVVTNQFAIGTGSRTVSVATDLQAGNACRLRWTIEPDANGTARFGWDASLITRQVSGGAALKGA